MKTVYYTRHAKSSWSHEGLVDKQRPLNARGNRDAPAMAKQLSLLIDKKSDKIDGIISSTAQRTRETLVPFSKTFSLEDSIIFDDNLYHAPAYTLVDCLYQLPDSWSSCIVFAHNPGMSDLYNEFGKNYDNVPTCGIFKVIFEASTWQEVDRNKASLQFFIYPKMFTT